MIVTKSTQLLDLEHLNHQTMGNKALEKEILDLFLSHITGLKKRLKDTHDASEKKYIIHTIKGTARGIGAWVLADAAKDAEADNDEVNALTSLHDAIDESLEAVEQRRSQLSAA